jgi:hypothetical protein
MRGGESLWARGARGLEAWAWRAGRRGVRSLPTPQAALTPPPPPPPSVPSIPAPRLSGGNYVVELAVGAFGQSPKSENTLLFLSTTLTVSGRAARLGAGVVGPGVCVNAVGYVMLPLKSSRCCFHFPPTPARWTAAAAQREVAQAAVAEQQAAAAQRAAARLAAAEQRAAARAAAAARARRPSARPGRAARPRPGS